MSKQHALPLAPRFRIFAVSFVVLSLLLVGMIIFFSSTKATVIITPKKELVSVDFPIRVEKTLIRDVTGTDTGESVKGIVISKQITHDKEVESSGTKSLGASTSQGNVTITIVNNGNLSQPLVATTRFLTSDDILFRLKKSVVVPSGGKIQAEVYPDKAGSNLSAGSLTIPGLNTAKQKLIYGESAGTVTKEEGGAMVRVVSEEDILQGKAQALQELEKDFKATVAKDYPQIKDMVVGSEIISASANAKPGDQVQTITITMKVKSTLVGYDATAVTIIAKDKLAVAVSEDHDLINFNDKALLIRVINADADKGIATLRVYADGDSVIKPSSPILNKENIAGITPGQAKRYLEGFDTIQEAQIVLFPSWIKKIPTVKDHIDVAIKK